MSRVAHFDILDRLGFRNMKNRSIMPSFIWYYIKINESQYKSRKRIKEQSFKHIAAKVKVTRDIKYVNKDADREK